MAPGSTQLDTTRLAAARLRAAQAQPFLAMALYALTPVADPGRGTFGVDERWRLYIDPQQLGDWSVLEVAGVLLHEVGHMVRDHAGRARTVVVTDEPARLRWNLAADAEINDDLLAAAVTLPATPVTPGFLGLPEGRAAEFYYARLSLMSAPPELAALECGPGCHGHAEDESDARRGLLPAGLSPAEALLVRRRIAAEIVSAARRQPGSAPGGWLRWAEAVLSPQLDWRRLLSARLRSAAAAAAGSSDYSYGRPPRRRVPRVVLPSMQQPLPRVAVIIDTSASVPEHLLGQAWSEVHGCLRYLGIRRDLLTVYAADTRVHRATGLARKHARLAGGGGTDMAAAIAEIARARPAPDLVVVLTDGLTGWPAAPPGPRVVLVIFGTGLDGPEPPSWAQVVRMPADASDIDASDTGAAAARPLHSASVTNRA